MHVLTLFIMGDICHYDILQKVRRYSWDLIILGGIGLGHFEYVYFVSLNKGPQPSKFIRHWNIGAIPHKNFWEKFSLQSNYWFNKQSPNLKTTIVKCWNIFVWVLKVQIWWKNTMLHGEQHFGDTRKTGARLWVAHVRFDGTDQKWIGCVATY